MTLVIDEMLVRINGEIHYLWRAVDHEGEVLEAYVTKARNRKAALRFLCKVMKRYGRPESIVTDIFGSYRPALRTIGNGACQETGAGLTIRRRRRTPTSRSDDENEQCNCFGRGKVFRNSRQFFIRAIISIRNAISTAAKIQAEPCRRPRRMARAQRRIIVRLLRPMSTFFSYLTMPAESSLAAINIIVVFTEHVHAPETEPFASRPQSRPIGRGLAII